MEWTNAQPHVQSGYDHEKTQAREAGVSDDLQQCHPAFGYDNHGGNRVKWMLSSSCGITGGTGVQYTGRTKYGSGLTTRSCKPSRHSFSTYSEAADRSDQNN